MWLPRRLPYPPHLTPITERSFSSDGAYDNFVEPTTMSQMNNLNGTGAMPVGRANHGTDGSPLPQDEKVLESTQFKKYKNWMYAAATIANSCEGYVSFRIV